MLLKVEGLQNCDSLDTIYLKRNRIGRDPMGDIEALKGLLDRPNLTCIDLSDNELKDPEIVSQIFEKLPDLRVLYLSNNPVTRNIQNYRKHMISKLPQLTYLDDKPVFKNDRRKAEAYMTGGMEAERKVMADIDDEE